MEKSSRYQEDVENSPSEILARKILCRSCSRDLTYTTNSEDYRIRVVSERIPTDFRFPVTDMASYNPCPEPRYYCDWICVRKELS